MSKVRVMYLRDASWSPVGCVAITLDRHNKRVNYQVSVVNPVDTLDPKTGRRLPFDSRRARLIALERLVETPISTSIKGGASMHDVSEKVMKHLAKSTAPNRAVKAAKLWLQCH